MRSFKSTSFFIRRYVAQVICFLALYIANGQSLSNPINQGIQIEHIAVNEKDNSIQLFCALDRVTHVPLLIKEEVPFKVEMGTLGRVGQEVVQKRIAGHTSSIIAITIMPPLHDAIFKGEERLFTIRYNFDGVRHTAKKRITLGTAIRHLDLRPYTHNSVFAKWVFPLIILMVISIFLMVFRTLYQKYRFKKEHINQYSELRSEEEDYLDPFTFETIQDTDRVVSINKEVVLLTSWKRLKKLSDEDETKVKFASFFKTAKSDTFFSPKTERLAKLNQLWYACLAMSLGWFFYHGLRELLPSSNISIIATKGLSQIESIFLDNLLFAISIGLLYGIAMTFCSQWLATKKVSMPKILVAGAKRALLVGVFFLCYTIGASYFYIPYLSYVLGWLFLSIALVWPLSLHEIRLKQLMKACFVGVCIAVITTIFVTPWGMASMGATFANYIGCLLLGITSSNTLRLNQKNLYLKFKNKVRAYCYLIPKDQYVQTFFTPDEEGVLEGMPQNQQTPHLATEA